MNNDCVKLMNSRDSFNQLISTSYNKHRHCNQCMFNVIILGGHDSNYWKDFSEVKQIDVNNLSKITNLLRMTQERCRLSTVCLKGAVYVFGGFYKRAPLKSVDKYSFLSQTWSKVTDIPDDRQNFCACAFMDKVFLFGFTDLCVHNAVTIIILVMNVHDSIVIIVQVVDMVTENIG